MHTNNSHEISVRGNSAEQRMADLLVPDTAVIKMTAEHLGVGGS